jgi:hypothetical protein
MPALQYQNLNANTKSVRHFRVLSGDPNDVIKCELEDADLDNEPRFIPLSHTWSSKSGHAFVECDGISM